MLSLRYFDILARPQSYYSTGSSYLGVLHELILSLSLSLYRLGQRECHVSCDIFEGAGSCGRLRSRSMFLERSTTAVHLYKEESVRTIL